MSFVILDLEATCWRQGTRRDRMETIEIGAVRLPTPDGPPSDEFAEFVRPIGETELSEFCRELTGIRQEDVDGADPFPAVFERFLEWAGPSPLHPCSWGFYDLGTKRALPGSPAPPAPPAG